MDSPFIYDRSVTGKNFIGRKADCAILSNLLRQGENVAIYEPPKTGKCSLIDQTLLNMRMSGGQFISGTFSVLNIRRPDDFAIALASALVRMVASSPDEYERAVRQYLSGTSLVFDPARFSESDEVVSKGWELGENDYMEVFRMPYRMALDKGTRMILVINEFQNIDLTGDGDNLIKGMERVMKEYPDPRKTGFSYIFSGSMVNAMKDIFERRGSFYRNVERLRLRDVDEKEISEHVVKGLLSSGKVIDRKLVLGACNLLRNNLWYINHFIAICDSKSKGYIMEPVLMEALSSLLAIHSPRFVSTMNSLTTHQVALLGAILDGCRKFSGLAVVQKYSLNSSANVKRVKDALMKKEIVTFEDDETPVVLDPLFEYWAKKYYFEKKEQ